MQSHRNIFMRMCIRFVNWLFRPRRGVMPGNKKWTIMVYLAGDNNLVEEMVFALREIYRIGARDDFDIIVQFDTGGPPRRFRVSQNPQTLAEEGKELESVAQAVRDRPTADATKEIVRKFLAK